MKYDSVFDVLGHIIVGPSSSHTAGACRIGYIAHQILGKVPPKVKIYLHGSFAETYKGHKTDVAIVGGLLGYQPDNERLPHSIDDALTQNMEYEIIETDLGTGVHPNSVLIEMEDASGSTLSILGSSIGGGNIIVSEIDGMQAGFDGDSPTLIEIHRDEHGVMAQILNKISEQNYNVKEMHLSRKIRKKIALSWIELNKDILPDLITAIQSISEVKIVRWLNV